MLNVKIVRAGLAGLLMLSLGAVAPGATADGGQGGSSEVSGSAGGTGDGGGQVSVSVTSSVTTAGSGGGDGGGVTASSSSAEVTVALNRPGFDGGSDDTEGSLSWDRRSIPMSCASEPRG